MKLCMSKRLLAALAIWTAAVGALAQTTTLPARPTAGASAPQGGERRGPPPESLAACQSLKTAQACSFTSPKGAEKGTCEQRSATEPLACRPTRTGPPPEALAACKGKALNAACTATTPEGPSAGTCAAPPQATQGTELACRPQSK